MATTKTKTTSKTKTGTGTKKPDIRKQIKKLLETIEKSWFEVSVLLADAYYGELYKGWEYSSFEEYAKAEIDMEYRSAMFRVQVGKTIKDLGITEKQVGELGWTKFKELTYILREDGLTKENMNNLFEQVKDLSFRETQDFVKQVRTEMQNQGGEGEAIKKTVMKFRLVQEQEETVQNALNEAMAIMGSDNEGLALEYICLEWLTNHSETPIAEIEEVEEVKPKRKERADVEKKKSANK